MLLEQGFHSGLQGNLTDIEKHPKTLVPFYILNFHKPIHFTFLDIVLHCLLTTQLPENRQSLTLYYKVPFIIERHQTTYKPIESQK